MCLCDLALYKDYIEETHMIKMKKFLEQHSKIACFLAVVYRILYGTRKKIKGTGNKVSLRACFLKKCCIEIVGNNNQIQIDERCVFEKCHIYICGNHNRIVIGKECKCTQLEIWIEDDKNKVFFGNNTRVTGKTHLAVTEGRTLQIGKRCLLASDITIRTGDSHSIINESGKRCNQAADVTIGDHVWIGENVFILKGTTIGQDTVVGTGSVVTKSLPQKVVAAGNPASVRKEHTTWDSERI